MDVFKWFSTIRYYFIAVKSSLSQCLGLFLFKKSIELKDY
jgi:hypothetical protein